MIAGLLIPTLILVLAALLITRAVEAVMPETLTGIALTTLLAAVLLWLASALLFAGLYGAQALRLPDPAAFQVIQTGGAAHFAVLGLQAAMIWGPVMALVIVTAPRRWRTNTW